MSGILKSNLNRGRNKTLDIYKGLLIILVVIRHVLQSSVADEGGILTNFIWAVQMPGFMFVSGYFSARKIDNLREAGNRILRSAQHYAVPFFAWFILIDVLLLGDFSRNPIQGLLTLAYQVERGLWFLWVVFILSVIFTFCNLSVSKQFNLTKKLLLLLLTLAVSYGVIISLGALFGVKFLGIKYILYYSAFYGFGWFLRKTESIWKQWWPRVENIAVAVALVIFLAIVYNYDLYHNEGSLLSISLRCVSGFAGNLVIITVLKKYSAFFEKLRFDRLGMYTLEVYVTHGYVEALMKDGNSSGFFTPAGFANFFVAMLLAVLFTGIIIMVFKSIPLTNYLFYGKKSKNNS